MKDFINQDKSQTFTTPEQPAAIKVLITKVNKFIENLRTFANLTMKNYEEENPIAPGDLDDEAKIEEATTVLGNRLKKRRDIDEMCVNEEKVQANIRQFVRDYFEDAIAALLTVDKKRKRDNDEPDDSSSSQDDDKDDNKRTKRPAKRTKKKSRRQRSVFEILT